MSPSRELNEALGAVLRLLERQRIPSMVMGGLALAVWGRVRATQDVDISLGLEADEEVGLLEELRRTHFLPDVPRVILGHRLIVCRYLKSAYGLPVQVDLFVVRGEYQRQALARAIPMTLGGRRLRVIAPEDLILQKLLADRPIDRMDVHVILEEQAGRLNQTYLKRWARRLGVAKRLAVLQRSSRQR